MHRLSQTVITFVLPALIAVVWWTPNVAAQEPEGDINMLLNQLRSQMQRVAGSFEDAPLSDESLVQQKMIVDQLELLIEQMSAAAQAPGQPEQTETGSRESGGSEGAGTASAEAQTGDAQAAAAATALSQRELILKAWGDMPAEARQRIGSGAAPQFLPGYERRIRNYYEKMAK